VPATKTKGIITKIEGCRGRNGGYWLQKEFLVGADGMVVCTLNLDDFAVAAFIFGAITTSKIIYAVDADSR
jgi:hypothetical protein